MILIYSHGGFGWFELCLQLWFCGTTDGIIMSHPQGEMIGLLPESHKNQDASVANKNPWTCENLSEIPGKILRKIRGNLSMEVYRWENQ